MRNLFILLTMALALFSCKSQKNTDPATEQDTIAVTQVQFNADSAYASVEKQCSFGPRVPNSTAHQQCGDYIVDAFSVLASA